MLRTKRQTIKLKAIIREGNRNKKRLGTFLVYIQLIDDRILAIKFNEYTQEYSICLLDKYTKIYGTYSNNLKLGVQKALLDCKYKVAVL